MAEYIDREVAIQAVEKTLWQYQQSVIELRKVPSADVAPVRHGHWISLTECANEGVYCSICKKKVWKSDYARCSKKSRNKLRFNYCPNCGAKMELEG